MTVLIAAAVVHPSNRLTLTPDDGTADPVGATIRPEIDNPVEADVVRTMSVGVDVGAGVGVAGSDALRVDVAAGVGSADVGDGVGAADTIPGAIPPAVGDGVDADAVGPGALRTGGGVVKVVGVARAALGAPAASTTAITP